MTLIHILGSDIPHHNLTILNFFNDQLVPPESCSEHKHRFMLVTTETDLPEFPRLEVTTYSNKKYIAAAIKQLAVQFPETQFFFHGQFNPYIWLAILLGKIKRSQVLWHIWGADLYEESHQWRHKLFYFVRRLAQRRVGRVFGTRGDLTYFQRRHPNVARTLLYFPTKMAPVTAPIDITRDSYQLTQPMTILVGNSGDPSNRHCVALEQIAQQFGQQVNLILPLTYPPNNDEYIEQIRQVAGRLFVTERVTYLTEPLSFEGYLDVIRTCDIGYFIFKRQQGIGTLCLLIKEGLPCVISRHNPFWHDLTEQSIPFLFDEDPVDIQLIERVKQQLNALDKTKIAFFNPNYVKEWTAVLTMLMRVNK